MSTVFTVDLGNFDDKNFTIGIEFPNGLIIDFKSDLNNISSEEINAFMKRFKKNKKCRLGILNSKKNSVIISYNPKEEKISFETWNEGYIFSDIEDNYNETIIKFKINEKERNDFYYNILEELEAHIFDYGKYTSDDDENE
jgi:hypothetical protein